MPTKENQLTKSMLDKCEVIVVSNFVFMNCQFTVVTATIQTGVDVNTSLSYF